LDKTTGDLKLKLKQLLVKFKIFSFKYPLAFSLLLIFLAINFH